MKKGMSTKAVKSQGKPATIGQIIDLVVTIIQSIIRDLTGEQVQTLLSSKGKITNGIRKLFREILGEVSAVVTPEADTIVRVDRSVKPAYPDWVKEILHPELRLTGPAEYPLAKVELWLHDDQQDGKRCKGQVIYDHLKANNILESCLGLSDLIAIQSFGLDVFRRYFKGQAVFAWKSVVRDAGGDLNVPDLYERGGKVVLDWNWLDNSFNSSNPALRFASCYISPPAFLVGGVLFLIVKKDWRAYN